VLWTLLKEAYSPRVLTATQDTVVHITDQALDAPTQ
jgi:hypothetical protein